ncbi:MAG: hypothetical protein R2835_00185 [Thermomicrobiales bacterium]
MTFATKPKSDGDFRSPVFPGGSLIRALLDRRLMGLADLGGSSALIGSSWSDIVSDHIGSLIGAEVGIPGDEPYRVEQVIRLDAMPHVAYAASKRSLQNPDFVLLGRRGDDLIMQAADAKFSIETARSKQVSVEMLTALASVGPAYTDHLGEWRANGVIVPGLFFAPQSAMTTYVLSGGRGITRATVKPQEVILLEATADELTGRIPGGAARARMAAIDGLEDRAASDLLVGLYYVRLSSAAGASWFDMHRPLFGPTTSSGPDFSAVDQEIARRASASRTAVDLVTRWSVDAEQVRADRGVLHQAASLPLPNRVLREWVLADAAAAGISAPSLNRVRKSLQHWVQEAVISDIGPIQPGNGNIDRQAAQIRAIVADLASQARTETARIVLQLGSASDLPDLSVEQVEGDQ